MYLKSSVFERMAAWNRYQMIRIEELGGLDADV